MLFKAGLVAMTAFVMVPQAFACSCLCDVEPPNWLDKATYVFRGNVVSVEEFGDPLEDGHERIRMTPLRITKGEPADILTIYGPSGGVGACSVGFSKGESRNVIAFREEDGKLWVSQCSQYCARGDGAFKALEGNN